MEKDTIKILIGEGNVRLRATTIDFMYINYFQKNGNTYVMNPVKMAAREFTANITNDRKTSNYHLF